MATKILIVEDDAFLGDVLVRKFVHEGYDVTWAKDGSEGLNQWRTLEPDLVLLDIILPTMNGYEILEARGKEPALAKTPVVIISNSGQPVEIDRALALGVKDYIIKAVLDPEQVLSKVKYQLEHPAAGTSMSFAGKKLLWVEDDSFLSDILARRFSKETFTSIYAANGEDALTKLQTETPDMVLLDLILPGMSGFDVLERIKRDEKTKNVPVIVFSNLGQQSDIEKAKQLGAYKHLLKAELNPDDVVHEIFSVLAK